VSGISRSKKKLLGAAYSIADVSNETKKIHVIRQITVHIIDICIAALSL
jgi:hypothetical protein